MKRGRGSAQPSFERARALLKSTPLVDGHNDLPWALRPLPEVDETRSTGSGSIWRSRSRSCTRTSPGCVPVGVGMQFWSVYVPCRLTGDAAVTAVVQQASWCTR